MRTDRKGSLGSPACQATIRFTLTLETENIPEDAPELARDVLLTQELSNIEMSVKRAC